MITLTMTKLLRSASASAREPASSTTSGAGAAGGGAADDGGLALTFGGDLIDEHLSLGAHPLEHFLGYGLGQSEFFDAEKFDFDAVVIGARVCLDFFQHLLFDLDEPELLFIGGDEVRERMLAHDAAVSVAQQAFQAVLG